MKLGLLITTYNRPQYLKQCLESIERADLSEVETIVIIDDASTDPATHELIDDFELKGVQVIKVFAKQNRSIKGSLLYGCDLLFKDHDLVMNLDGDAIVRHDFVQVLITLKFKFPGNLVCGFNTTVKNRNPILEEQETYFKKKYASGINMLFNKDQYEKYIKPALMSEGNWDFNASLLHEKDGKAVIVAKPSVVQHIGIEESSMGHISGSEPPDVAEDFIEIFTDNDGKEITMPWYKLPKLQLPNVTLFGIAYNDPVGLHRAAEISQLSIEFGAVVMITEKLFEGRIGYSHFCIKELNKYIKTDYVLRIEPDGYVQNAAAWNPDWLNYDLIGSPWEWYTDQFKVGNGVSLRSKRLHDILANDDSIVPTNDQYIKEFEEDHNIARIYRPYLEKTYGIKFAPIEEARKFGIEAWRSDDDKYSGQFLFHGYKVKGLPFPPLPKVK